MILTGCSNVIENASKDESTSSGSLISYEISYDYLDDYIVEQDATILTIAAWDVDGVLELAVEQFNQTHTDYQVEILPYFEGYETSSDMEAALKRMNASLISGEHPDMFAFNSMDVEALHNAGLILDLYTLMDADEAFDQDAYFMDVWSLFARDGRLYEWIPCFQLVGLVGDYGEFGNRTGWTFAEWETAQEEYGKDQLFNMNASGMASYLVQYSLKDFIDVDSGICNFNSDGFVQWLEFIAAFPSSRDTSASTPISSANLTGVKSLLFLKTAYGELPSIMGWPSLTGSGVGVTCRNSYGICSTTEYPEVCWEFLCTMLSESIQASGILWGFPMLKSQMTTDLSTPVQTTDGNLSSGTAKDIQFTQEDIVAIYQILGSVSNVQFRYDDVSEVVLEEVDNFLAGIEPPKKQRLWFSLASNFF